jgi:hypothetical protein
MYDAEEAVEKLPDKEPSTSKQACVQGGRWRRRTTLKSWRSRT